MDLYIGQRSSGTLWPLDIYVALKGESGKFSKKSVEKARGEKETRAKLKQPNINTLHVLPPDVKMLNVKSMLQYNVQWIMNNEHYTLSQMRVCLSSV